MHPPFSTLVIGCGGMSTLWLDCLLQTGQAEIVGLVDRVTDRAEAQRVRCAPEARVFDDYQTAITTLRPAVVIDLTTPEMHHAVGLAALRNGCHLLAEKPMADSMEHARELLAAAREHDLRYAIMQNRRYLGGIHRVRRLLNSGAIGELTTIHSDFQVTAHFGGFREQMHHVLLLDMAIHTFDAARFLSGANAVTALAHEWNPAGSWYAHGASAAAIFELTGGVVYTYRGTWCGSGLNTTWEAAWRLIGTSGTITWDGADAILCERAEGEPGFHQPVTAVAPPAPDPQDPAEGHLSMIREFYGWLAGGPAPSTLAEDNQNSLAMVFAALESAHSGRKTNV